MKHVTCTFGIPVLKPEVAPRPRPSVTWAEMAWAEGHRPGIPPSPGGTMRAERPVAPERPRNYTATRRVMRYLAAHGPTRVQEIVVDGVSYPTVTSCVDKMRMSGLVESHPAPTPRNPRAVAYALTPAGRAALEATP